MPFDLKTCLEKGLLRKVPPSKEKALQSLEKAKKWLRDSEKAIKGGAFDSSVISSYLAMFHSARSILFYDGYREKSHACIARYLEEKYAKTKLLEKKWIELLDYYRDLRHEDQYDLRFFITSEEAKKALKCASEFTERMERLLKKEDNWDRVSI